MTLISTRFVSDAHSFIQRRVHAPAERNSTQRRHLGVKRHRKFAGRQEHEHPTLEPQPAILTSRPL